MLWLCGGVSQRLLVRFGLLIAFLNSSLRNYFSKLIMFVYLRRFGSQFVWVIGNTIRSIPRSTPRSSHPKSDQSVRLCVCAKAVNIIIISVLVAVSRPFLIGTLDRVRVHTLDRVCVHTLDRVCVHTLDRVCVHTLDRVCAHTLLFTHILSFSHQTPILIVYVGCCYIVLITLLLV